MCIIFSTWRDNAARGYVGRTCRRCEWRYDGRPLPSPLALLSSPDELAPRTTTARFCAKHNVVWDRGCFRIGRWVAITKVTFIDKIEQRTDLSTAELPSRATPRPCHGHCQTNGGGWSRLSRCNFKPPRCISAPGGGRKDSSQLPLLFFCLCHEQNIPRLHLTPPGAKKTCLTVFRFLSPFPSLPSSSSERRERSQ